MGSLLLLSNGYIDTSTSAAVVLNKEEAHVRCPPAYLLDRNRNGTDRIRYDDRCERKCSYFQHQHYHLLIEHQHQQQQHRQRQHQWQQQKPYSIDGRGRRRKRRRRRRRGRSTSTTISILILFSPSNAQTLGGRGLTACLTAPLLTTPNAFRAAKIVIRIHD